MSGVVLLSSIDDSSVLSPCVGVCTLDPEGYCLGCRRTGEEIGAWPSLGSADRLAMLAELERR